MSPLQKILADIHPKARIVSVEVDAHEHQDTVCCEITRKRLVDDEALLDGSGIMEVDVAKIVFEIPGQGTEVLSETDSDWVPYTLEVIREALEMARDTAASVKATDANVSERAKRIAGIDEQIDDLAVAS